MVPLPLPGVPDVMLSQDESLDAVHGQPLGAVTLNDPDLPPTGALSEVGEKLTVQ